jgi:signal transduction histidine kinase
MESFCAPSLRAEKPQVLREHFLFSRDPRLRDFANATPGLAAILNQQRQVVYCNDALLTQLGISDITDVLGARPGEALHCIHADDMPGGCGTSEACRYCGANLAILQTLKSNQPDTRECRITVEEDGFTSSREFQVHTHPFWLEKKQYVLLSLNDIQHEKRRRSLERIFFHDILNLGGGLSGLIELELLEAEDPKRKEGLQLALELSQHLIEEIEAQRQLMAAESGEMVPQMSRLLGTAVWLDAMKTIRFHGIARSRKVELVQTEPVRTLADPDLLRRVLVNMLKNALEATPSGGIVEVGVFESDGKVRFWVKNEGEMPEHVRKQVFQRSFSTKGADRGLGTYSMKLLGEKYLQGKVGFQTSASEGTVFYIDLPN